MKPITVTTNDALTTLSSILGYRPADLATRISDRINALDLIQDKTPGVPYTFKSLAKKKDTYEMDILLEVFFNDELHDDTYEIAKAIEFQISNPLDFTNLENICKGFPSQEVSIDWDSDDTGRWKCLSDEINVGKYSLRIDWEVFADKTMEEATREHPGSSTIQSYIVEVSELYLYDDEGYRHNLTEIQHSEIVQALRNSVIINN